MSVSVEQLWRGGAAQLHYGVCDQCDGEAFVARQVRARTFQCLACFTRRPTGSAELRKRVRSVRAASRSAAAKAAAA